MDPASGPPEQPHATECWSGEQRWGAGRAGGTLPGPGAALGPGDSLAGTSRPPAETLPPSWSPCARRAPQPTPVPSEFSQMVTPSDPIQWGVRPEPPKDLGALDSGGHFPPGTDSGQQAFQASAAVAGPLRSPWALGRRLEDAASSWGHPQTS